MADICIACEGSGLRILQENGRQVARPCECRAAKRAEQMLAKARIPKRFRDCSFDSYETTHRSSDPSLRMALGAARHFFEKYPLETAGRGLLFSGSSGLGKTHLAVSVLKGLILERGAGGVFWEHKEMLESLRATYGGSSAGEESRLLRTMTTCDILVLDDVGEITPSDWSWDTTSYILNTRYNGNLSTILTTNLENRAGLSLSPAPYDRFQEMRAAMQRETLGDRIGERMRSRLQEMCVTVELRGEDFRQKVKRASFA